MSLRAILSFCAFVFSSVLTFAQTTPVAATPPAMATPAPVPDYVDQLGASLKPTRLVTYKKIGDRSLNLHIFEPEGLKPADRRPAYVIIHGGGWSGGAPKRMYPFAEHFARLGMVTFAIEYRLLKKPPGTTPADCARDGRSAVRYIRAHAAEFGVDPAKIIVSGGSAGGHVAAGTALFEGLENEGEDLTVSCVPTALVLLFPVIDTSAEGYGHGPCGAEWEKISPLHQVKAGAPPTLVFHGTGDIVTPFKGAAAFRDAMVKAGNRCELVIHEGGAHGYLMRTQPLYDETMQKTEEFLRSLHLLPVETK